MIYVDALRVYPSRVAPLLNSRRACGEPTCHLATDGPIDELHEFARGIGVPRMAFHARAKHPHYDLRAHHRALAVAAGAVEVTSKELVRKCFKKTR